LFVTMPQFEQPAMSRLAGGGQKYWRAITGTFAHQPWYLFVYEAQIADARVPVTMLVAWEESLIDVIEMVPVSDRRSVYRVDLAGATQLTFSNVRAIWAPASNEANEGLTAVLALEGRVDLLDPQLRPVSREQLRRLVYQAPALASSQSATMPASQGTGLCR
jgi:hypothetical protein